MFGLATVFHGEKNTITTFEPWTIESPNFDDSDGFLYTSPVGAFSSGQSVYGLEDTFGNAWEFTADDDEPHGNSTTTDGDAPETMAPDPVCMSEYVAAPISSTSDPIQAEKGMSFSPKYVEKPLGSLCKILKTHGQLLDPIIAHRWSIVE